jgi:hypothetical protein
VIVENYKVYTDKVRGLVGNPMLYEDFIKKGKKNPEGSNVFSLESKAASKNKYQDLIDDSKYEEETANEPASNAVRPGTKNNAVKPNNASKGTLRLSNEEESRPRNNFKENNISNASRPNSLKSNQVSNNLSRPKQEVSPRNNNARNESRPRPGPIERMREPRESSVTKGNQKRPGNEYNRIKELFVGMENFVLLVRVLFVNPVKNYINKRGVESTLQSIEVGDESGTIECTMFGEVAQKFEGKFKEDQIFEIANASVSENTYMGQHTLRMIINDLTRVSLREDDPSVPFTEDFCVTVKQLLNLPIGELARVICLVKVRLALARTRRKSRIW